jgi:hypothetical protein
MASIAAVVCAAGLLGCAQVDPPPQMPGHALGFRRALTPDITEGVRLAEAFTMYADGFTAITVRPSQVGTPRGTLRFEISVSPPDTAPTVRRADVPAMDVVRGDTFRFTFPPIAYSKNDQYRLTITSTPGMPAGGVAFWRTKENTNPEDMLIFNGVQRWGDLVYQTEVVDVHQPRPVRRAVWFALGLLVINWVMLARLLKERG